MRQSLKKRPVFVEQQLQWTLSKKKPHGVPSLLSSIYYNHAHLGWPAFQLPPADAQTETDTDMI